MVGRLALSAGCLPTCQMAAEDLVETVVPSLLMVGSLQLVQLGRVGTHTMKLNYCESTKFLTILNVNIY